jgi:hypothetical protein
MAENQMSPQESQEILSIAKNYFVKESGSVEAADEMMKKLAGIVQEQGAKLVHIGNVLFLVMVRGKGVVEFHTIGSENTPQAFANDIVDLTKYIKNIGANLLYTYSESRIFDRIAKLTGLPIVKTETDIDGKRVFVYAVEF